MEKLHRAYIMFMHLADAEDSWCAGGGWTPSVCNGLAPQTRCICNAWVSIKAVWWQHAQVGVFTEDMGSPTCRLFGMVLHGPRFSVFCYVNTVHNNPTCKEAAQSYCVHCSGNNCMWWRLLPPIGSLLSSQLFCKDNYFSSYYIWTLFFCFHLLPLTSALSLGCSVPFPDLHVSIFHQKTFIDIFLSCLWVWPTLHLPLKGTLIEFFANFTAVSCTNW